MQWERFSIPSNAIFESVLFRGVQTDAGSIGSGFEFYSANGDWTETGVNWNDPPLVILIGTMAVNLAVTDGGFSVLMMTSRA